jgi:hypothetical protein
LDSPELTEIFPDNPDGARGLRDQAAACRRLAGEARTKAGTTSMNALADRFDEQALRVDLAGPTGRRRAAAERRKAEL